ncbi:MAG: hypothetical protein KBD01_08125 [Acidobacteria bacterium]|nr:hypothetical protein [Acidobacteriota bacterium]
MSLRVARGAFTPVRSLVVALVAAAALAPLAGCGQRGDNAATGGEQSATADNDSTARMPGRRPGRMPGARRGGQLPPGHPPLEQGQGQGQASVAPPPPGSGTGENSVSWTAPEGWTSEVPNSALRRAQYRLPGSAGEGQCTIFYFGPQQGGGPEANAERWAEQFQAPGGGSSREAMKSSKSTINGIPVTVVEIAGTFVGGGMGGGPTEPKPNSMLLGAIAEGPDANWFIKCIGPEPTMRAQRPQFDQLVRSLRRGA